MTKALFPALAFLALAAPAVAGPTVRIQNFAFQPGMLVVTPGTKVVWTNADDEPHTVTARDHTFHSAAIDGHETFAFTFVKPGDYAYFCSLHPHMTGHVVVKP